MPKLHLVPRDLEGEAEHWLDRVRRCLSGSGMRYKVKWRSDRQGPLKPEVLDTLEAAKARVRELLAQYGDGATIDVWNEDETWQIVSPTGVADWSKKD